MVLFFKWGVILLRNTYNAIVKQAGNCWIGWVEEIPGVNCQEFTKEELLKTLEITLGEILELNRKKHIVKLVE